MRFSETDDENLDAEEPEEMPEEESKDDDDELDYPKVDDGAEDNDN
jgi:hypothetical protein